MASSGACALALCDCEAAASVSAKSVTSALTMRGKSGVPWPVTGSQPGTALKPDVAQPSFEPLATSFESEAPRL